MTLVQQFGALLLVAWLPGAILFRMPCLDRERRAALDPGERAFWAIILSLATSLTIVLALAAGHRYSFERLLLINAAIAMAPLAIWRSRLRLNPPRHVSLMALAAGVLAVFCVVRFAPPAEYIMGGKDPGTYINEGVQIAQRGSFLITDPVVASVPAFARDLFLPRHVDLEGKPRTDYYSDRFMAFKIKDPEKGTVVGQFPHLFPASIAIGYGLDGLSGARRTTIAWAALGVVSVFFFGARLFGRAAGLAAAVLLTLNVVTLWFSRYPNGEVVMQALSFAALLANARAHADGDRFFAPVAGALVGLLLFLRFDAVLVVAGIGGGLVVGTFAGQRPRLSFVAAIALFAVPAIFYYLGPMRAYADLPIVFIQAMPWWQFGALAALTLGALASAWAAARSTTVRGAMLRYVPVALAGVLCVAGTYALVLRHPGGKLAAHDAYSLRMYANFYVTVPAVLAALLGFALYARRAFWKDAAFFSIASVFALFVFYKIRIIPEHFWAARRFLPVILPATMLLAAAAAFGPGGRGWRVRFLRPALGAILLLLLGAHYVRASRPLADHVEYAGLIPHVERLAARIGDRDLVIVESRDAGSDVHVIGLPLAYLYARNVLVLSSARPDRATLALFLEWARTQYGRVLFLGGGGTDLLSYRYGVEPVVSERFQVPEFESAPNAYPRYARRKEFEYGLYEFTHANPRAEAERLWFDLDVGTQDDLHVLRFHAKEASEGRTFRWTTARSLVAITTIAASSREVTLVLGDGGRPAAAPPARVEVFLHNQRLGSVAVEGPYRPYTLAIPPDLAARAAAAGDPVELRLLTATWNPGRVLGSPDQRDLGVMVDRVTIK